MTKEKRYSLNREKGAPPLYAQIETILKTRIENGEFQNGDIFLSEKQLQALFGVSRITVRQAVNGLVREGYLHCAQGVGTTVVFGKIDEKLKQVVSFSQEMQLHGITMQTGHCTIRKVVPGTKIQRALLLQPGEKAYCLQRVRWAGGLPIVYSETYMHSGMQLSMNAQEYTRSLYALLNEQYGIRIAGGTDMLEAVAAAEPIAGFLEVEPGTPLFRRTRKTYDQNNSIIEYSVCYYPGDRYQYTAEL